MTDTIKVGKSAGDRKFNELSEDIQKMLINENGEVLRGLNSSVNEWASKALRFLILVNTGGALIIFTQTSTLIGKVESLTPLYYPAIAFIFGIMLAGTLNFYIWHKSEQRLRAIRNQNQNFYRDKSTTLGEYVNSANFPQLHGTVVRIMGLLSAFMFLIGVSLGLCALNALIVVKNI